MLDRIIIGPSLHPDVIRQPLEAELRSQEVALWDQLVCVSDIPLRQPSWRVTQDQLNVIS